MKFKKFKMRKSRILKATYVTLTLLVALSMVIGMFRYSF